MPSKKRKYEARFPPARIKKIMQTDEEIGKVAAAVPVIISRSLEIFLQSLVETTARYTGERKAKTMTTAHLKHCIEGEKKFDFLKDLVSNIADIASKEEEDGGEPVTEKPKKQRKPRAPSTGEKKKRKKESSEEDDDSEGSSDAEEKEKAVPSAVEEIIPPISSMTSSVPSSSQQSSHSIDAIMGNTESKPQPQQQHNPQQQVQFNQPLSAPNMLPPFSTLHANFPSLPAISSSVPMHMNLPMSTNDDEDDDYDM